MGSLASGIFDLFAGDPTKKEQNQLGSLAGYDTGLGESDTTAASNYDLNLLSGDPSKIAQAEAPEITAGQNQVQQVAGQNAQFGNRGGGTNASTQAAQGQERGNIIDLTGQVQGSAAQSAAGIGGNLLSQASGNLNSEAGLASANQKRVGGDIGGIAQGAAQIIAGGFGGAAGAVPGAGGDFSDMTPYEGSAESTPFTPEMFQDQQSGMSPEITPFF